MNDRSEPRPEPRSEPLHQPPNPADLRRVPPQSPQCARVRGWLRDFADHDLEAALCREVEEHAHRCRRCAVELARAEHEVLRVRRAFATLRHGETPLPEHFAARVVDRLLLDETTQLSADANGAAAGGSDAARPAAQGTQSVGWRPRLSPGGWLAIAFGLLMALVVTAEVLDTANRAPERVARLVVIDANGTFHGGRLLGRGDGVGEQQQLHVGPGGGALLEWHDLSSRPQPAATLQLHGKGEVRLEGGAPLVASGRVDIETNRSVSIGMGDGSRIDLGIGEYSISAELLGLGDGGLPPGFDALPGLADDLLVKVEVKSGDDAVVMRSAIGPTLVAMGHVGVYRGSGAVALSGGGGMLAAATPNPATRVAPGGDERATIAGHAFERNSLPSVGAVVWLSFASFGVQQSGGGVTDVSGAFTLDAPGRCRTEFAIVSALPPFARRELGILAPNAVPLVRHGEDAQLYAPLVFDTSTALVSTVLDDQDAPRAGVHVVPCVVDELFGLVLALGERAVTDHDGRFRLERLPAQLPAHQSLVIVVSHEGLEPIAVAVPARASAAAGEPFGPVRVRQLRQVRMHYLPASAQVEILEEIVGLPPGTAVWKRTVTTNVWGQVATLPTGYGRMWLRGGSAAYPIVYEMILDEVSGLPRFLPGLPKQYSSVFRPLNPLPDSDAEIASAFRHQRFHVPPGDTPTGGQAMQAVDHLMHAVPGAQVFAVDDTGPRGSVDVRFLGFTSPYGFASLQPLIGNERVVVVGNDGTVGLLGSQSQGAQGGNATVQLPQNVRVLLHESRRPQARMATIRFERLGEPFAGMAPVARRFPCEATAWEVGDLPPGEYRAIVEDPPYSATIELAPGGFVVLQ